MRIWWLQKQNTWPEPGFHVFPAHLPLSKHICPNYVLISVSGVSLRTPGYSQGLREPHWVQKAVLGTQNPPALPVSVTAGATAALGHWWRAHMKLFETSRTKIFRFVCTNACASTGIIHGWELPVTAVVPPRSFINLVLNKPTINFA